MHDFKALVQARLDSLRVDPARAIDIVDELSQHVAQHYGELVASGVDEQQAMRRALAPLDPARDFRRIGSRRSTKAGCRRTAAFAGRSAVRRTGS